MAQRSRDGIGKPGCPHRACSTPDVIWTRSASSHTGRRRVGAASAAGTALTLLIGGRLADERGRRSSVQAGLTTTLVATLLLGLSTALPAANRAGGSDAVAALNREGIMSPTPAPPTIMPGR